MSRLPLQLVFFFYLAHVSSQLKAGRVFNVVDACFHRQTYWLDMILEKW